MNPNQPNEPLFGAPYQSPVQQQPQSVVMPTPPQSENSNEDEAKAKKKMLLIFGLIAGLELLIIIILLVVVVAGSGNKKATTTTGSDGKTSQSAQGPQPANADNVQLTNDSISEDISSLDEDKDFPADKFSDRSLGL